MCKSRIARRSIIEIHIKCDAAWKRLGQGIGEPGVSDSKVGSAKIVVHQRITDSRWEAIPADEAAAKPNSLVILYSVVLIGSESEAVCAGAVFVVHHLGVFTIPSHIRCSANLIVTVLAGPDVLGSSVLHPNRDL